MRRWISISETGRPTVAPGPFSCQWAQLFPVAGSYTSLNRRDGTATPWPIRGGLLSNSGPVPACLGALCLREMSKHRSGPHRSADDFNVIRAGVHLDPWLEERVLCDGQDSNALYQLEAA